MKNQLFKNVDYKNDQHWIVKEFFNSIFQQDKFLWALPFLVEKKGCSVNEEFCFFPDLSDPDPVYHFAGVAFGTMDDEVVVTDEEYQTYLKEACDRYLEYNPESRVQVEGILDGARA